MLNFKYLTYNYCDIKNYFSEVIFVSFDYKLLKCEQ